MYKPIYFKYDCWTEYFGTVGPPLSVLPLGVQTIYQSLYSGLLTIEYNNRLQYGHELKKHKKFGIMAATLTDVLSHCRIYIVYFMVYCFAEASSKHFSCLTLKKNIGLQLGYSVETALHLQCYLH